MSAPDTNTERQTEQHRAPLAGIGLAALVAVGLILFLIAGQFSGAGGAGDGVTPAGSQADDVPLPDAVPTQDVTPGESSRSVTPDP